MVSFLISVFFLAADAQTSNQSVLSDRLCKTWKIEKMIQDGKTSKPDNALSDFVLIIHPDHTVQQGMNPDGLIKGSWTLDEKNRVLAVKDNETGTTYQMKVLSVSTNELVLEDQSPNSSLTIYYKAKQ